MAEKKKILVTGAAGRVGCILRAHWGDRYWLRLVDIRPIEELGAHEEFARVDIADFEQMQQVCAGMDAVVHLAADPNPGAEFYDSLLPLNIIGAYNAFEAARQANCQRLVFASSGQAVLGYHGGAPIRWISRR